MVILLIRCHQIDVQLALVPHAGQKEDVCFMTAASTVSCMTRCQMTFCSYELHLGTEAQQQYCLSEVMLDALVHNQTWF